MHQSRHLARGSGRSCRDEAVEGISQLRLTALLRFAQIEARYGGLRRLTEAMEITNGRLKILEQGLEICFAGSISRGEGREKLQRV